MDWNNFLSHIGQVNSAKHRINPPCPSDHIEIVQHHLGEIPALLIDMLRHFDGAELFIDGITTYTLFEAISDRPEWNWTLDRHTTLWREAGERPNDWAFGRTLYGSVFILQPDGAIREWDSQNTGWLETWKSPDVWAEWIIREGERIISS